MIGHILIATDGSELAGKAVRQGLELAARLGARATFVTVSEPWSATFLRGDDLSFPEHDYDLAMSRRAAAVLAAGKALAVELDVPCDIVHVTDAFPAEGIVAEADRRNVDLIVMASHGRRGIGRLLLGSQTARVLALTSRQVLICR